MLRPLLLLALAVGPIARASEAPVVPPPAPAPYEPPPEVPPPAPAPYEPAEVPKPAPAPYDVPAPAPAPYVDGTVIPGEELGDRDRSEVARNATQTFDRGARTVQIGKGLILGGAAAIGVGIAISGFVDPTVPLVLGGAAVVVSPIVLGAGLATERSALEAVGVHRKFGGYHAGAAVGAVLGTFPLLVWGPPIVAAVQARQHKDNRRAFARYRVTPELGASGAGARLSGEF